MFNCKSASQAGVVLPLVALTLVVLLGLAGLVIDMGGLFVAKTELQSALDSCALAAAQQLDGAPDALTRATNAGMTAGNVNKVQYQATAAGITNGEITFSGTLSPFTGTATAATARYAKCGHTKNGIGSLLIEFVGGATSNSVGAVAVASRVPGQVACNTLPIGIQCNSATCDAAHNFGLTKGQWIAAVFGSGSLSPGQFGWANLCDASVQGCNGNNETKSEIASGFCRATSNTVSSLTGATPDSTAWNSHFGLYKNGGGNYDVNSAPPDFTGYAYTPTSWPSMANALSDFNTKRAANTAYQGDVLSGVTTSPETSVPSATLASKGKNKRLVAAPIINGTSVKGWACLLMLEPMNHTNPTGNPIYLEFIDNADSANSPCHENSLAGGTTGPLVPALVQ